MTILDNISGHEFEDLMEDVFRNLGYQNVRQSVKTGDEGRDILMEETVNGQHRGIVVECKHQERVGRPVVQKLHSAIVTYDFEGPKRGLIATTGRVTDEAREYADQLRDDHHVHSIEFIDGNDLREMADEIGLDLYNGHIEIVCDRTLRPVNPAGGLDAPVRDAFESVKNFDMQSLPESSSSVSFEPIVTVEAQTDATFETSVGVVHRVNERDSITLRADRGTPEAVDGTVAQLIEDGGRHTVGIDDPLVQDSFDEVSLGHFGETETGYKEWMIDRLREQYTETVEYTGDNNVDYEKECVPKLSDVSVGAISSLYVPRIRSTTDIEDYTYSLEYYAAGPSRSTIENGIGCCVHCDWSTFTDHTFCANCGSINCRRHIRTERVEGNPVCTVCAVSDRFGARKRFFYDEENRDAFRDEYEAMSAPQKALENKPLVASSMAMVFLTLLMLL